MAHDLRTYDDAESLAHEAARFLAWFTREAGREGPNASIALSGGKSPWAMLRELATTDLDWARTTLFQVDERVAPEGAAERNLTQLRASLQGVPAMIVPMDVTAPDLEDAAARYSERLPERLDLVHLGLGPDGHCASLVPGDPVLEEFDRAVAVTGPYQGTRRLTLTYPTIDGARQRLWLVSGADKRDALARLLDGDPTTPAGRVLAEHSLVLCDKEARGQ